MLKLKVSKVHIIIGVDNGINGGIVAINFKGNALKIYEMPTIQQILTRKNKSGNFKKRNHYNESTLVDIFYKLNSIYDIQLIMLEQVIAMPKQSSFSTGTTFEGFGFIKGVAACLKKPYQVIHPITWSAAFCKGMLGDKKSRSIKAAMGLFPRVNLILEGKKRPHDGIAEALLIAEYGRRGLVYGRKGVK